MGLFGIVKGNPSVNDHMAMELQPFCNRKFVLHMGNFPMLSLFTGAYLFFWQLEEKMNFVRFPGNQKKNMPTHMAGSESEHIPIEGWSNGLVRVLVLHLRK